MAKKKKAVSGQQSAVSNQRSVVSDQPNATPYTVLQWSGLPLYRCSFCKFDTLEEIAILRHIEEHRLSKPQGSASVLVADKRGNVVTDQVASDGDLNGVFEVELQEVESITDEHGNEHKTFTIKE